MTQGATGGGGAPAGEAVRPLAGVRVVSLAEQYPGPYATLLMADLGAEIILVERPAGGDPARQFPRFMRRSTATNARSPSTSRPTRGARSCAR